MHGDALNAKLRPVAIEDVVALATVIPRTEMVRPARWVVQPWRGEDEVPILRMREGDEEILRVTCTSRR